ncbi:hypothetical protein OG422_12810 [Streptomyces sp. NBC_01525]|uniref:hypothetical protein n=1 Tax=Streptomyces sp. NBC_01525 TaxID=2903893 RepID=UPI00163D63AD|nr:hypothetical protein [Streptomyces benahoarensis]
MGGRQGRGVLRRRRGGEVAARASFAALVHAELAEELPDVDLDEDLAGFLERYESPACTDAEAEEEFLDTVRQAAERLERGY